MLCSNCGRTIAKTLSKYIHGKEVALPLCPDCFRALYPAEEEDFFKTLLGDAVKDHRTCPACGATLEDFRATGLLGCADCYKAFRKELIPTVRTIHGRIRHQGKESGTATEEKYDLVRELVRIREEYRERIRMAEASGNTGLAAAIKERLSDLERSLHGEDNV